MLLAYIFTSLLIAAFLTRLINPKPKPGRRMFVNSNGQLVDNLNSLFDLVDTEAKEFKEVKARIKGSTSLSLLEMCCDMILEFRDRHGNSYLYQQLKEAYTDREAAIYAKWIK